MAGDGARAELATESAKRSKYTLDIRVSSVVVVVPHTHTLTQTHDSYSPQCADLFSRSAADFLMQHS